MDRRRYRALTRIIHDVRPYEAGEALELSREALPQLIEARAIEAIDDDAPSFLAPQSFADAILAFGPPEIIGPYQALLGVNTAKELAAWQALHLHGLGTRRTLLEHRAAAETTLAGFVKAGLIGRRLKATGVQHGDARRVTIAPEEWQRLELKPHHDSIDAIREAEGTIERVFVAVRIELDIPPAPSREWLLQGLAPHLRDRVTAPPWRTFMAALLGHCDAALVREFLNLDDMVEGGRLTDREEKRGWGSTVYPEPPEPARGFLINRPTPRGQAGLAGHMVVPAGEESQLFIRYKDLAGCLKSQLFEALFAGELVATGVATGQLQEVELPSWLWELEPTKIDWNSNAIAFLDSNGQPGWSYVNIAIKPLSNKAASDIDVEPIPSDKERKPPPITKRVDIPKTSFDEWNGPWLREFFDKHKRWPSEDEETTAAKERFWPDRYTGHQKRVREIRNDRPADQKPIVGRKGKASGR